MASEVKVGDELAIQERYGGWAIYKVDKITPSGRIKCGHYTLNPDLSIRAPAQWGPYRAHPVTKEIRQDVNRKKLVLLASHKFKAEELTDNQLERIIAILEESP